MKTPSIQEALGLYKAAREDASNRNKGGDDEKLDYLHIYKSLTKLQQVVLAQHATDIIRASKQRQSLWTHIKHSQTYLLLESCASLVWACFILMLGAPMSLFTRPLNMLYIVGFFGSVYSLLFMTNVIFLFAHLMGVEKIIKMLSEHYGAGWSPINWLDINMFTRKDKIIENARYAFCSELADFEPATKIDDLHTKRRKLKFNVDVARSILLMCSILYERDVAFVEKAASGAISQPTFGDSDSPQEPNEGVLFLLKSEEPMYHMACEWNLRFVSMADFRMISGPFAGAFYDYETCKDGESPFIVIVIKGTSPDNFTEWLQDCACKFDSAGDFLGTGLAHSGFYNSLFPSKDSDAHVLPYMRIVETIKMIAGQGALHTQQKFHKAKKTNLFIGGHSLGAGIAQLLYARFLEAPEDLGDDIVLRDGYLFGTPRACDHKLASRVEFNMNKQINQGRQLWRVANRAQSTIVGDIVTRLPPGFADKRAIRSGLRQGSYYAYAAIGTRVDLTPNAMGPPFYRIEEQPVGHKVVVCKKTDEAEIEFDRSRESSQFMIPRDIVQISMWVVTHMLPCLHDHFPASYMDSLCKMQARTYQGEITGIKKNSKPQQQNPAAQNVKASNATHIAAAPTNTVPGRDK